MEEFNLKMRLIVEKAAFLASFSKPYIIVRGAITRNFSRMFDYAKSTLRKDAKGEFPAVSSVTNAGDKKIIINRESISKYFLTGSG